MLFKPAICNSDITYVPAPMAPSNVSFGIPELEKYNNKTMWKYRVMWKVNISPNFVSLSCKSLSLWVADIINQAY